MFPLISKLNYTNPTLTIADWGTYSLPFVPVAPEYWFWGTKAFGDIISLNKTQTANVFDMGYSWFGLMNSYNSKMFSSIAFT